MSNDETPGDPQPHPYTPYRFTTVPGFAYTVPSTPTNNLAKALEVRDALFEALCEQGWSAAYFDGLDPTELAEWLIRSGWVKGQP